MSNTLTRTKQFIDFKSLSISAFEKTVGFSNGSFSSQLKNNKTIGVDKVENILKVYPEINPEWLLTGNGEMLKVEKSEKEPVLNDNNEAYIATRAKKKLNPNQDIPVYFGNTRGGIVTVYNDDPEMQKPVGTLSTDLFPGCDHAERITGDSMYPIIINQGIAVGKVVNKEGILWGEKYGLHTKHGMNVAKYIHPGSTEDRVKLVSYNKSVPEQEIPRDDIVFCFRIYYIINPA